MTMMMMMMQDDAHIELHNTNTNTNTTQQTRHPNIQQCSRAEQSRAEQSRSTAEEHKSTRAEAEEQRGKDRQTDRETVQSGSLCLWKTTPEFTHSHAHCPNNEIHISLLSHCHSGLPCHTALSGIVGLSGRRGSEGGRDSSLPSASASAGGGREGGSWRKDQTMPIIDGVGDELLYTALLAAPLLFLCRHSLGQSLSFLKQGVYFVRVWVGSLWGSVAMREEDSGNVASPLERTTSSNSFAARMNSPPENDCCSVCHDSFSLPCQANCSHWFCGECILRVWQHSSVLQPCKCPICRRAITLLLSTEISEAQQQDSEVSRIIRDIEKYNRIFGGGPVSFMQRVRDMPLLLRRMVGELMDPQRAIPLVHRTRILFFLVLLAVYVFSPLDVIPEGVLGLVGLLDDLLVIIMVLFYLAMLYRSTLILHHGGQPQ